MEANTMDLDYTVLREQHDLGSYCLQYISNQTKYINQTADKK